MKKITEIIEQVKYILKEDIPIEATTSLFDLPSFDSLHIVQLIERLEKHFEFEMKPEFILPETFATPQALADAVNQSLKALVDTYSPFPPESAPQFLHDLFDITAKRLPQKVALLIEQTTISYASLCEQSDQFASWLQSNGVKRGDRIAILLPNSLPIVVTLLAASRIGAIFVILDPALKLYGLRHLLDDAAPTLIITTQQREHLDELATYGRLFLIEQDWKQAVLEPTKTLRGSGLSEDPLCLIYTSGSTSQPKAIISAHYNVLFATQSIQACLALQEDDVIGCFLPLSFDYGLYQLFLSFQVGATLALGKPDHVGPVLLQKIQQWGITGLPVVPTIARALLQLAGRTPEKLSRLRFITNTGAHLPENVINEFQNLLPTCAIFVMYGLTECKRVAILSPSDYPLKPMSVGKPLPATECFILNEQGQILPPGQIGELVVRGRHVMLGYWQAPEQTSKRFRLWGSSLERTLFTGDLCSLDEEGYLYFHGRNDDIYKFHEYRIGALEVETAAYDIAGVLEAALVIPDVRSGPVLFVCSQRSQDEIFQELRLRLEDAKVPNELIRLETMPHTSNGKIQKELLKAYWKRVSNS